MKIRNHRTESAHNVPTKPASQTEDDSVVAHGPQNEVPYDFMSKPEPVAEPAPVVSNDTVEVIGIRPAPNKNFIYASLNGERVTVFAGKRWAARLAGKKFKAAVESDGAQTTYRYHP
jgi:hypothetical protein